MTSIKDDVVRIIERYFCDSGERIESVTEYENGVEVQTRYWHWCVSVLGRVNRLPLSPGYRLFGIDDYFEAAGQGAVTMLPDGRMFHLNDKAEFLAFFSNARHLLAPLELAGLLASFQSTEEGHENVFVDLEEISAPKRHRPFLTAKQLSSFGVSPPEVTDWSGATMRLCFYTRFSEDLPHSEPKVSVNRWQVELDAQGQLVWRVEPVARRVDSPFYKGEE